MIARAPVLVRFAATVLVLALALPASAAEEGAGTRAAAFLGTGDAPAVLGMAGATLALGRDLQGAAWNPAALAWVNGSQASLAHASFADQATREWLALGSRLGHGQTRFGLSALVHDEGTIEGRDEFNRPTGTLSAQDLALTLQVARPFGEHLALGGAAHLVGQRIGDASGQGLAFDAGAQARFGFLSLAMAGRNFGGGMMWDHVRWNMPASLGAGVALEHAPSGLRIALDVNAPADYYRSLSAGAEWRWHDRFALRGGWREEFGAIVIDHLSGPSFGMGAGVGAAWFDYGFVLDASGTATHRVGLSLHGGGPHAPVPGPPAPR